VKAERRFMLDTHAGAVYPARWRTTGGQADDGPELGGLPGVVRLLWTG
jgi:hypothetical protein